MVLGFVRVQNQNVQNEWRVLGTRYKGPRAGARWDSGQKINYTFDYCRGEQVIVLKILHKNKEKSDVKRKRGTE